MIRYNDIKVFFEEHVTKKMYRDLSLDRNSGRAIINSRKLNYDFDEVNYSIKTSDTLFFKSGKIIFVEFKRGSISDSDFRLKATESIISFYNFIHKNGFTESLNLPNDIFQIYFVYDKNNSSPSKEFTFKATERKLKIEYKHLYSKYEVIDNDKFKRLFKI